MRLGETRGESRSRARARAAPALRRGLTLLLLPAAALAVAAATFPASHVAAQATSSTPEEPPVATHAATVDGSLLLGWGDPYTDWASSSDGIHFSGVRVDSPPKETSEACVPSTPEICYRVAADSSRIEKSADGGTRWEAEWPDWLGQNGGWYVSTSSGVVPLAILEREGGYQVFVPSGWDGFAVRAAEGTWSMVPDLGAVAAGVMFAPTFATVGSATVLVAIGVGVVLFLLSLTLLSLLVPEPADSSAPRWAGYGPLAFAQAVATGWLLVANPHVVASKPPFARGFELSATTIGAVLVVVAASVSMILLAGTAIPSRPQERRRILVSAALVGVAGGLARLFPWPVEPSSSSRGAAVAVTAVVALALAAALGLWREKRHRAVARSAKRGGAPGASVPG